MKGFEVMGQMPSNTIVKYENRQLLHLSSFQGAAYFQTKLLLKNSLHSDDPDKEAYFIHLTKPSFCWQPGAIDKRVLFWLNYKSTYEHWNEQRGAFTTPTSDSTRLRSIVNVPISSTPNRELNFMFQLHIFDLGIAIPLQQYDPPTKLTTTDSLT
ncbi:unnamed protein product [Adineta steineri]|uniref:Bridge-like lipid transfer protein family member 1 C-terminal domain-containing protein n=1 Tax=Adineta steineri TaxID=433720 RepID=A0A816BTW3_9BILA|nr:unnamed protein product [Adineta steineri]CAF1613399.1 unnamed protein product [Adineta steineri]